MQYTKPSSMVVNRGEQPVEYVLVGHKPGLNQLFLGHLGKGLMCKEQKHSIVLFYSIQWACDDVKLQMFVVLIYMAVSKITDITLAFLLQIPFLIKISINDYL